MTRLSVAETIRFAYSFTFQQIGTIIGLVWLPLVLIAILQFLPYAIGTAYPGTDASDQSRAAALNLAFFTGALALYGMNWVVVTRQALGLRKGTATFHFALGWPEWRMFTAIVMCGLALVASTAIYLIVGRDLFAAARAVPLLGVAGGIYVVVGLCGVAWLAVRFMTLLPPIIVVDERVDFGRAWVLSRGNFWRILAVMIAVTLPLLLIQIIATAIILGPDIFAPLPGNPDVMAAALQARAAMLDHHMATLIGLALVLAPFSLGLTLGACAYMYRSLAGDRSGGRVPPQQ
jgi:hypothetical protein